MPTQRLQLKGGGHVRLIFGYCKMDDKQIGEAIMARFKGNMPFLHVGLHYYQYGLSVRSPNIADASYRGFWGGYILEKTPLFFFFFVSKF